MSSIGYYRFKCATTDGRVVKLYKNGLEAGSATIKALDFCTGDRIIKYLDSKGQYRFYSFNKYYEINDKPKSLGTTNEFITSILTAQTNEKNLGYSNTRSLQLTTTANTEQLEILSDLWTSPKVYLYIGTTTDTAADWLEVTIKGGGEVRRRKANSGKIDITVTLPEWFTIRSI